MCQFICVLPSTAVLSDLILTLAGLECHFGVSMVGRCSKGRRRPARNSDRVSISGASGSNTAGEGGSRGPDVATDRSHGMERSVANVTGRHARSHSLSMANTVDMTDVDASPADVDLVPFIDWGGFSENHHLGMAAEDGNSVDMLSDFGQFNTEDNIWSNMDNLDMPSPFETSALGLPMASTFPTKTLPTPPASATGHPKRPTNPYPSFGGVPAPAPAPVGSNLMSQIEQQQSNGSGDATTSASRPGIGVFVKVLSNLETELGNLPPSIDRTMHVVNTSTKSVHRVSQCLSTQLGVAGPMLALVSIDMILILIESIISRWRECRTTELSQRDFQDSPRLSDNGHGQRDQLLLGHYKVEGEETDVIWRNIIIAELRRVRKLIQGLNGHLDDPRHSVKLPVERLRTSFAHLDHRAARLVITLQRYDHNTETSIASAF